MAHAWLACLVCACIGATTTAADRNPRQGFRDVEFYNPPPVTERGGMGEWLLRLVDQYRVEGMVNVLSLPEGPFTLKGSGDCAPVGDGPGVHCILSIHWTDKFEIIMDPDQGPPGVYNVPGGVSYLNPSMMLLGIDPPRRGLQLLLVDNKGLPEGGAATIAGDRATMRAPCVNAPALFLSMNPDRRFEERYPQECERIMRIDARPGSTVVHVDIDIEINSELVTQIQMTLRRARKDGQR